MMKILINALGIQDSGGITVLKKVLSECKENKHNKYFIVCNENKNISSLISKYEEVKYFTFISVPTKGFLHRLYYENIIFNKIIQKELIDLIYNFSGSAQFFSTTPQLVKVQNLLFYSKKLDNVYQQQSTIILWLKHIYLKRLVFITMLRFSANIEIQSLHVKNYLSDFIDISNKQFVIKSDIDVTKELFTLPKQYDFNKKLHFLYIVGPHFEYVHKNFMDFTKAMTLLKQQNLDFEISITLTKEQLHNSILWDNDLNAITNFLGYINTKEEAKNIFSDNTILVSTSIIETIGLHVVEAIQNGILAIVPDEPYTKSVYGNDLFTYKLFHPNSLSDAIQKILLLDNNDIMDKILQNQQYLITNENSKSHSIVEIFEKVKNVQK